MKFCSVSVQMIIPMGLQGRFEGHRKSISRLLRCVVSYNGDISLGNTILGKEPDGIKRCFEQWLSFFFQNE